MGDIYDDNPLRLEFGAEIRVLELLNSNDDITNAGCQISCRLHTISLGDGTPYVAVSYVWGSNAETEDILLDGNIFPVRINLYRLLQKMARRKFSSYFWVDAICVNQTNVRERNQQVALMERIYQKASTVVVWLNPQSVAVDYAMVFLARMYEKGIRPEDFEHVKWALKEICYLEYWSRAWIVQEFTLAENIELWGSRCSISGDVLSNAAYDYIWWLKQFNERKLPSIESRNRIQIPWTSPAGKIISCRKQWRFSRSERQRIQQSQRKFTRPEGLPFDYVFSLIGGHGRQLQCADVRDRVYAMLSLLREEDKLKAVIKPDYSQSVAQLFFEICTKVCKDLDEVEKFRELLELSPRRKEVQFIHSNWPLRLKGDTYGSNELDMSVALLLPRYHSPTLAAKNSNLIPRHLAARVDLYASVQLQDTARTTIRLLRILPSDNGDTTAPISCSLRTVLIGDDTEYAALSYAWGGDTPLRPICVNGYDVNVCENLALFLKQARERGFSMDIWIDAICINHENLVEKTQQTKSMGQIYAKASIVVAWLGPDVQETSPHPHPTIAPIVNMHSRLGCCPSSVLGQHNIIQRRHSSADEYLKEVHHVLDALESVLWNKYWTRTWIAQEFVLANEVELWAGRMSLNGDVLSVMCETFTTWPRKLPPCLASAQFGPQIKSIKSKSRKLRTCRAINILMQRDFRQGYCKARGRWKLVRNPQPEKWHVLEHLLAHSAESDCTDSRDHVYALLSLLSVEEQEYFDIVPDYTTPGSQLFINLACAFCARHGLEKGWDIVQHLAEPLCLEGHVDLEKLYRSLKDLLQASYKKRWQLLASRVIYEMSGEQACFEPEVRDGG